MCRVLHHKWPVSVSKIPPSIRATPTEMSAASLTQMSRQIWEPWYHYVRVPYETGETMLVGYARTSSLSQVAGLEAQERELRTAGCEKLFREQVSSVAQRDQLEAALEFC